MILTVNGRKETLDGPCSVADLLAQRNLKAGAVVVEVNGEIPDRDRYADLPLSEGDRVEILHFVGGG